MPGSTPTSYPTGYSATASLGDGWVQPTDTASFYTAVAGCSYPNPWSGAGLPAPTADPCNAGAGTKKNRMIKRVPSPKIEPTPAPVLRR